VAKKRRRKRVVELQEVMRAGVDERGRRPFRATGRELHLGPCGATMQSSRDVGHLGAGPVRKLARL